MIRTIRPSHPVRGSTEGPCATHSERESEAQCLRLSSLFCLHDHGSNVMMLPDFSKRTCSPMARIWHSSPTEPEPKPSENEITSKK